MTLKSNLWSCFKRMQVRHGAQHFDFMPPTFVLPTQMAVFEDHLRSRGRTPAGDKDVWILKPAAAYCGRGIFLHRTKREDCESGGDVINDAIREHRGVACRYIDPPFLLDGLKSDIRLYVLVTSWHPFTLYLYEEGLARFATEEYDTSSLDKRCSHLTNYSLNKHSTKFVKNTNDEQDDHGSKWSLTAFKRRLIQELGEERAAQVWRNVDDVVTKALIAAEPAMTEAMRTAVPAAARGEPNRQCFQAFGFDVMLDGDAKPWLLEVNLDPALRTESPLDLKIKSSMLVDLLNVVGMPLPPAASAAAAAATQPSVPMAIVPMQELLAPRPVNAASGLPPPPGSPMDTGDSQRGFGSTLPPPPPMAPAMIADGALMPPPPPPPAASTMPPAAAAAQAVSAAAAAAAAGPVGNESLEAAAAAEALGAAVAKLVDAAFAARGEAERLYGLTDMEKWALHLVNCEFERSKKTRWRRLFPSSRSSEYFQFLDPSHRMHQLPFDV